MPTPDPVLAAKQQRWTLLVTEHTATFNEVIRLANQFPRDVMLAGLKRQAEAGLSALRSHDAQFSSQPHGFGSLGEWGQNGRGPMIQGLARSARFHAGRAAEQVGVAA
jgi:hypothetical protein